MCVYMYVTQSHNFHFQDGHEICFVGDEAFRELSQTDPKADQLINEVSSDCVTSVNQG